MTQGAVHEILKISVPITMVQFLASLFLITDTVVTGLFAPGALAALGGGNGIFLFAQFTMVAAMFAVDGFMAQASGKTDLPDLRNVVGSAMVYALALGSLCVLMSLAMLVIWSDDATRAVAEYVFVSALSLPFYLAFLVFQKFWNSLGATRQMLHVNIAGVVTNAVTDVVLITSIAAAPQSAMPIALATVAARIAMLGLVIVYSLRNLPERAMIRWFMPKASSGTLKPLLRLGASTGGNGIVDSATFLLLSLGAIYFGATAMQISQYAMTLGLALFSMYFGVANAATILCGRALGRKNFKDAQNIAQVSLRIASLFAAVPTCLIVGAAAILYHNGQLQLAIVLLCVASYQLGDAVQAVGSGILRSSNIGAPQFIANTVAFYVVGPLVLVACLWADLAFLAIWFAFAAAVNATGLFHFCLYRNWHRQWVCHEEPNVPT